MADSYYQKFLLFFKEKFPKIFYFIFQHRKVFKFLISGGSAAVVTIITLFVLTDLIGIWYVLSSAIAFMFGFLVSFTLQKFWTFQDMRKDKAKSQAVFYFIVTVINLGLNTLGIFLFVDYLNFHYLLAQFIVAMLLACITYFIYSKLIFNR